MKEKNSEFRAFDTQHCIVALSVMYKLDSRKCAQMVATCNWHGSVPISAIRIIGIGNFYLNVILYPCSPAQALKSALLSTLLCDLRHRRR